MLTDTAFLDDAQVLGGVPCEPPSTEPCWVNMSTLSSGASGSSSSSSSSNSTNSSSSSTGSSSNNGSAVVKKRRKSDTKPLSQLNKCLNEKRRREQENVYIEELAELISASIADMNSLSVKPDKCAILQETVNQIRRIKEQEEEDRNAHGDDGVQQGEVSSSKPALLDTQVLGTFLLEALDGFLFVVNTEGKIEYVSENVTHFLQYCSDDLVGKSIYNIIHLGDHARFSSSLLPTSIGWPAEVSTQARSRCFNCRLLVKPPDDQEETMEEKQQRISQYENMQISAVPQPYPGEKSEPAEVNSAGDSQHCLVCVARRIPAAEKQQGPTVEQFTTKLDLSGKILAVDTSGVSPAYSQYLNKDLVGCVIRELCHPDDLNKLTLHLKEALQNNSSTSPIYRLRVAPSVDREKAGPVANIFVQTKSKKFPYNPLTQEAEFVMATHSVIGDNELALLDCDLGSGLAKAAPGAPVGPSNGNPVLTSVVRSDVMAPAATPLAALGDNAGFGLSSTFNSFPLTSTDYEFNLDLFPTSTWGPIPTDVDDPLNPPIASDAVTSQTTAATTTATVSDPLLGGPAVAAAGGSLGNWGSPPARPASTSGGQNPLTAVTNLGLLSSRPSSRQSAASTPRPPSVSAYSPAPNSVLGIHSVVSPLTGNPGSAGVGPQLQPSPASMNLPYSSNFPFSPLQETAHLGGHTPTTNPGTPLFEEPRETKDGILHLGVSATNSGCSGDPAKDANSMLNSLLSSDTSSVESSGRLRVLLMQRSALSQANGGSSTSGQNSLLSLSLGEEADNRTSLHIKRERNAEKSVQDNRILKNLLDQEEDDDAATSVERLLAASASRSHNLQFGESVKASPSSGASSSGNEMLHTLLNQRNDDDDLESRHGLRKQNELLKQLLKDADEEDQAQHKRGEQLLKSLGFTSPPASATTNTPVSKSPALVSGLESMLDFGGGAMLRGTKRPSEEAREDVKPSKQASLTLGTKPSSAFDQGSSSSSNAGGTAAGGGGGGVLQQLLGPITNSTNPCNVGAGPGPPGGPSLCERNKMLASLLAKTPLQPTLPVSTASPKPSSLPQEKLPRDLKEKIMQNPGNPSSSGGNHWTGGSIQPPPLQQQQQQQQPNQQQQQNTFPVQQSLMQQRLQHPGPSLQQQQQQVARSQNAQQQQQPQQLLQPHAQQQPQQLPPKAGSFLNTLLARSVENTGPGLRNTITNDQQHFLQQPQQQQQQQVQLNSNASINPVQLRPIPPGMVNQNQVGLSAALNSGGSFTLSLNDVNLTSAHSRSLMNNNTGPAAQQPTPLDSHGPLGPSQIRNFSAVDPDFPADWGIQGSDSLLSDILDQAIEMNSHYEPVGSSSVSDDFVAAFVEQLISSSTVIDNATLAPPPVTDINEKLAISAIQESLMSFETSPPALPAYNAPPYANAPTAAVTITQQNNNQVGINAPAASNSNNNPSLLANQQTVVQRRQKLLLQQQQRRLVGRPGQASLSDNSVPPQGSVPANTFHQMDDLLNGVPPNMTITRSGTIPDSQSSPGFGARLLSSPLNSTGNAAQISPGLRNPSMQPPFSPHGQVSSSFGTTPVSGAFVSGSQSRLSPLGNLPTYSGAQVSPRVQHQQQLAHFSPAQLSPQSGSMGLGARASPGMNQPSTVVNWSTSIRSHPPPQQQQQQQQQPGPPPPQQQQLVSPINNYPPGSRGYAGMVRPSMRSLPSPGPQNPNAGSVRQGSFNALPDGSAPNIGVSAAPQGGSIFLQQQTQQHPQMRLQRSISTSSTLSGQVLDDGSSLSSHLGSGRRFHAAGSPPSALIHHPASRYPGGSCLAGRAVGGAQPSYAGPAHLYSARVVAIEQSASRLPAGPANDMTPFTAAPPVHPPASLDDPPYFSFDSLNTHTPGNPLPISTELQPTAGQGSVTNNSAAPAMTSEFVRKELRAVVGARTNHSSGMTLCSAGIIMNQPGHGMGNSSNSSSSSSSHPLMPGGQSLNQADLESLGLSLELPTGGSDGGKSLWDSPSLAEPPNQRQNTNKSGGEDTSRSSDPKMSLLQKLLSE